MIQQPRQYCNAAASDCPPHRRRQLHQRSGKNIGQHQIERLGAAQSGMSEAGGRDDAHARCHAIEPRVVACNRRCDRIVVAGEHARGRQRPRRRNAEHPAAAAEIEHACEAAMAHERGRAPPGTAPWWRCARCRTPRRLRSRSRNAAWRNARDHGCRARRTVPARIGGSAACDSATQFASGTVSSDGFPRPGVLPRQQARDGVEGRRLVVVGLDHERRRLQLEQRDGQRLRRRLAFQAAGRRPAGGEIACFDAELVERAACCGNDPLRKAASPGLRPQSGARARPARRRVASFDRLRTRLSVRPACADLVASHTRRPSRQKGRRCDGYAGAYVGNPGLVAQPRRPARASSESLAGSPDLTVPGLPSAPASAICVPGRCFGFPLRPVARNGAITP